MRVPITCGSCGRDFSAPQSHVGRRVVCPGCGEGVRVSAAGGAADEDDDRPRPQAQGRRARGQGPNLKVLAGIVGAVAAVAVLGMALQQLPSLSQMNTVVVAPPPVDPPAPPPQPAVVPETRPETPAKVAGQEEEPQNGLDQQVKPVVAPGRSGDSPRNPPKRVKPKKRDRDMADDEFESERGQRLLAQVKEIYLVREENAAITDPRKTIWNRVSARAKVTLEKLGVDLVTDSPSSEDAVLTLALHMKPVKKAAPGTQELSISAELTCFDPEAADDQSPYAKVWKSEDAAGTITRKSAQSGKIPQAMDDHIAKYFSGLRLTHTRAKKSFKSLPLAGDSAQDEKQDEKESESASDDTQAEMEAEPESDAESETEMNPESDSPAETAAESDEETESDAKPKAGKADPKPDAEAEDDSES